MSRTKVMIADDHSVVRIGLATLLATENDLEVVGEADDGAAAVQEASRLKPDVVIMDLMMPGTDGVDATIEIRRQAPETRILILTTFAHSDNIRRALNAGASGALLKSTTDADLISAIRRVARGDQVISEEVRDLLSGDPPVPLLTKRQMTILESVTKGQSNREIASHLNIREDSVGEHLTAIFSKLGAANRTEAVAIALRKHLLKI